MPKKIILPIFFIFSAVVYLFTLPLDLIDIDSAQYAEIAREMVAKGDYLFLRENGRSYLDKPIFTFWMISSFFQMFGIHNFAMRLPAVIFTILGGLAISGTAWLISGSKKRAWMAGTIYLTVPGVYAMVVDPKIDVYLTAILSFVLLFFYLGLKRNNNWFYVMYIVSGLGFITKGPIAAVIPILAIGGDILLRQDWKRLLSLKLFTGLPLLAIFPAFWSWVLFQEYSTYGPSFFLWIQSFGRFYRKMYNQKLDPAYFYMNFSWAFLVFLVPLLVFIFLRIRNSMTKNGVGKFLFSLWGDWKNKRWANIDFVIPLWVFLFLFLISFSRYQLPQYVFWTLPAAALFMAGIIEKETIIPNWAYYFFPGFVGLVLIVIPIVVLDVGLSYYFIALGFIFALFFFRKEEENRFLFSVIAAITMNLVTSLFLYPELLKYQPSHKIGTIVRKMEPDKDKLYTFFLPASKKSYGFYAARMTKAIYDRDSFYAIVRQDGFRLIVMPAEMSPIFYKYFGKLEAETIGHYPAYKVATPSPDFFNRAKRAKLTNEILLVKVKYDESKKETMPTIDL